MPHAIEAIRMQGIQTHKAVQPISIQLLQTQQKPHVTEAWHNAEKHSLLWIVMPIDCPLNTLLTKTTTDN